MSGEGKGDVTMIGMHSLASLTADGLVPELQALVSRRRDQWMFRMSSPFRWS